jgi:hypothetical protein
MGQEMKVRVESVGGWEGKEGGVMRAYMCMRVWVECEHTGAGIDDHMQQ